MIRPLVVIGAGGFGRETLDVVAALNEHGPSPVFDVLGVIDANPSAANLDRLRSRGIAYLGTERDWLERRIPADFLVAIGSPALRSQVTRVLLDAGLVAATAVHPSVGLGTMTTVGAGSVICAGAQVSTNVRIGEHVHINPNATIGHDSVVADFVSVNPAAIVSGDVTVASGALIGAGAVVLQGLTVGAGSTVGAAACVVRDVPPRIIVKGIPAR